MKLIIQSPDFKTPPTLLEFIRRSVEKLETFNKKIIAAKVCLKTDPSGNKEDKICEVMIDVPGANLFAQRKSDAFEDAVTQTVEALRRQIESRKD